MSTPFITEINAPVLKSATAITAAVGANTETAAQVAERVAVTLVAGASDPWWMVVLTYVPWDKVASLVAALYTCILAAEWVWKKMVRPFAVSRGWMSASTIKLTPSEWAALAEEKADS